MVTTARMTRVRASAKNVFTEPQSTAPHSPKVQNVPQNLRITSTRCEINNDEGPQCWTTITVITQYDNIKQQTNITTFKIRFHIVHSAYDYRVVTVSKFSNPAGLLTSVFLKRFIPGFTTVVKIFMYNNLLSSCTGGFYSKHLSMWTVSSNLFADNVRFGHHENFLTWFRIFISCLFSMKEEIGRGGKGYCYGTQFELYTTMPPYTKRCTKIRRVCWSKFGRNPIVCFCLICVTICLSLLPRQGLFLDFACLSIYIFDTSPELYVCLSIYENAETCHHMCRCRYMST